jgi:hypothetical protein
LAAVALTAVNAEWSRNTSRALRAAERASGMSREELGDQLEQDSRLVPLYIKLVYAAGMNGHDDTLRAMGAVFGLAARAARDDLDDELADAEDALNAMRELGPRHFTVMADLRRTLPDVGEDGTLSYPRSGASAISERTGLKLRVAKQCLINLEGAGIVEDLNTWDGESYELTDLGQAVIAAAEAVHPA